jgi:excisionase family DNA binding protein
MIAIITILWYKAQFMYKTTQNTTQNNFYTVQEVSELLKLSVLTIYKYIRDESLEAVQFGRHYRIEKSSLDKFVDSHRVSRKPANQLQKLKS